MLSETSRHSATRLDRGGGKRTREERAPTGRAKRASGPRACSWSRRTASRQRCNRWSCPACRVEKGEQIAEDVLAGLEWAANRNTPARLVTITDGSRHACHLAEFNARFARLSSNLARAGLRWDHYFSTLGVCPASGRLHRHLVALGGPFLARTALEEHAARARLGFIDVRAIRTSRLDRKRVAHYIASNAVEYARFHTPTAARVQPFSRSRSTTTG